MKGVLSLSQSHGGREGSCGNGFGKAAHFLQLAGLLAAAISMLLVLAGCEEDRFQGHSWVLSPSLFEPLAWGHECLSAEGRELGRGRKVY